MAELMAFKRGFGCEFGKGAGCLGGAKMRQCRKGFEFIPHLEPSGQVIANVGFASVELVGEEEVPGHDGVE